jgi:carboxyl-terminal processing protease
MRTSRFTVPLVAGLLGLGVVLGVRVGDAASGDGDFASLQMIEEAFGIITQNYVEPVDSNQLAADAIEGMLAGLDPHSVYIPSEEMQGVREAFDASFEGIGIYFEMIEGPDDRDTIAVLMPIAGGPSEEAGLQAGDRIVQIGDTTAIGFTNDLVQDYLRGPRGSRVEVEVRRRGFAQPLEFTITRDRIPLETVVASYMVDEQTGYVKLQRFARTSHQELLDATARLREQGMQRLILDLRGNAGGLLEQAYRIADEFLPAGAGVVSTRGRYPSTNRAYGATAEGALESQPVIVLVDENSASASEIVAGALQDHDRALVVGRRTFGKGLVQQQFPLTDGSVLQMTVSRYFTPSGRLIQTPYDRGAEDEDYFAAKQALRAQLEDRLATTSGLVDVSRIAAEVPDSLKFRTDHGRIVFGGGGILPDYLVRLDTLAPAVRAVIANNLDAEYARVLLDRFGPSFREQWGERRAAFIEGYRLDDAAFNGLLDYAATRDVRVVATSPAETDSSQNVLARDDARAHRTEIETRLKAYMARRLFGVDAFYPVVAQIDDELNEAMRLWAEASALAAARPER